MPFLCHSSHILSIGLPWWSSSHNFTALFWVTAAKEFSISQNLIRGKRPNKRLGSHPVYFLSRDVTVTPPHLSSLPSSPLAGKPSRMGGSTPELHCKAGAEQNLSRIMDSWVQLTEEKFSTRHTFDPRGLCRWMLLDKIHPGESCQSKEQRPPCSQQELRDAVPQALTTPVSGPVFSPQKVLADTEGL